MSLGTCLGDREAWVAAWCIDRVVAARHRLAIKDMFKRTWQKYHVQNSMS
ncbi:hypothetical protein [Nannocystis pusilla]